MDSMEIYQKAKEIMADMNGMTALDSLLILEVAKQQIVADSVLQVTTEQRKPKKAKRE
jgi:hypothetical protein